jgi:hypothetical protein
MCTLRELICAYPRNVTFEFERGDRGRRRLVIVVLAIGAVVAVFLIPIAESRLGRVPGSSTGGAQELLSRVRLLAGLVTLAFVVPVTGMAVYLLRFAARVLKDDRFPPNGVQLTRDVTVLHGRAARRRARVLQSSAVVMLLAVIVFVAFLWRLVAILRR